MVISVRVIAGGSFDSDFIAQARALSETLGSSEVETSFEVRTPRIGQFQAAATFETLWIFVEAGGVTLTGLMVTDIYKAARRWFVLRLAQRRASEEHPERVFGTLKLYGPNGELLRRWDSAFDNDEITNNPPTSDSSGG